MAPLPGNFFLKGTPPLQSFSPRLNGQLSDSPFHSEFWKSSFSFLVFEIFDILLFRENRKRVYSKRKGDEDWNVDLFVKRNFVIRDPTIQFDPPFFIIFPRSSWFRRFKIVIIIIIYLRSTRTEERTWRELERNDSPPPFYFQPQSPSSPNRRLNVASKVFHSRFVPRWFNVQCRWTVSHPYGWISYSKCSSRASFHRLTRGYG